MLKTGKPQTGKAKMEVLCIFLETFKIESSS